MTFIEMPFPKEMAFFFRAFPGQRPGNNGSAFSNVAQKRSEDLKPLLPSPETWKSSASARHFVFIFMKPFWDFGSAPIGIFIARLNS